MSIIPYLFDIIEVYYNDNIMENTTTKQFLIEKIISLGVVGTLLFTQSLQTIVYLFIVLGQAHFLIAYIYKYKGKIKNIMPFWYPLILIPLLILGFLGQLELMAILAALTFIIHFAQDEIFLAGKKTSLFTSIEILTLTLVLVGIVIDLILMTYLLPYFFAAAIVTLLVYAYLIYSKNYIFNRVSIYLNSITAILVLITFFGIQVPLEKLIGAFILLHYSAWYINYFYKVQSNTFMKSQYFRRVIIVNLISIGLFFIFLQTGLEIFSYFFAIIYFYAWTIIHILVSVRISDYTDGIKIK